MGTLDVLVVGAGQAGLAVASALERAGLDARVHDRHPRIGDAWRRRHDGLRLFSPRAFSALAGLPMDGEPEGIPSKDEVGDYLERYARRLTIPVTLGDGVARLARAEVAFEATTQAGLVWRPRAVVLATGPFASPRVPPFAQRLSSRVLQLDAASYKNVSQVPAGPVVVAGDGATGRQIALELAATHEVALAMGRPRHVTPQRVLGQDAMWWSDRLGLLTADKASRRGRLVRRLDAFPGAHLRASALRRAGIELRRRVVDATDEVLRFADGSQRLARTVVWAIGYRDETSWVAIPEAVTGHRFAEDRGPTAVPGLFHVGREWQNNRGSALLCGVHRDAEAIARRVNAYVRCG